MKIAYHPEIGKVLHWFCKTRLLKNDAVYVYVSRNCIHTFFSFEKNYIFWHCWWMIRNKNQKTRKRVLFYRKSSNLVSKDKYALKLSENAKNSRFFKTQQKSTSADKNNYIDWCDRCSETKTRKRVLLYQKSSNLILKKHL